MPLPAFAVHGIGAGLELIFIGIGLLFMLFVLSLALLVKVANKNYKPEKIFSFLLLPSFFCGLVFIYVGQMFGFDRDFNTFMNASGFVCCFAPILVLIKRYNKCNNLHL